LEVGGGTLTGVAPPSGAEPNSGATGGNRATQGVAVSGGSDAILRTTDDSGAISATAAMDIGTTLGAAAGGGGTVLGVAAGDGSMAISTCAAACRGSARAMGFVAARISGALPKESSASQVAVVVAAANVVTSIPQPSAVTPSVTKRKLRRGGGGTAMDEMSPKVPIA
jgi:hypothetical protein